MAAVLSLIAEARKVERLAVPADDGKTPVRSRERLSGLCIVTIGTALELVGQIGGRS
jgi:hypothetical protein